MTPRSCAPHGSLWGAWAGPQSLRQGEGKLSTETGEEVGQETEPAQAKRKDSNSQPPAPRGAGAGSACARPGPQFPQRGREAPGGPETASRGGTRAHAGARRRRGERDCGGGRRERGARGAGARRRAGTRGPCGSAPGGAWRPQPPTPGEGCVSFAPAGGQDVGAGQRQGGGGGVGGGEPVAAAGAPASGQLAESATFLCNFCKREGPSASCGTALGRPRSHEQRGGDPQLRRGGQEGAPGRGRTRRGMPGVGARGRAAAAEAACVHAGCARRAP